MKRLHVFNFNDRLQAGMLKEILAKEGINCVLKNDRLASAVGEIPFIECRPELWVIDDEAYPRAKFFIESWLSSESSPEDVWCCPSCGEHCDGQFGACWACGTLRD